MEPWNVGSSVTDANYPQIKMDILGLWTLLYLARTPVSVVPHPLSIVFQDRRRPKRVVPQVSCKQLASHQVLAASGGFGISPPYP